MQRLLFIGLGGALGSIGRYLVHVQVMRWSGGDFPWGTFAVNLVGSFVLGALAVVLAGSQHLGMDVKLGLSVGLLGGFTTYSTFSVDTLRLLQEGAWQRALGYVALTVVVCLGASAAGFAVGTWWTAR